MSELKPCPFCGCEAMINNYTDKFGNKWWEVFCTKCTGALAATFPSETTAVEHWNRRAEDGKGIYLSYDK